MYLVIGADLVPTESNRKYFETGSMEQIISQELLETLKNASVSIYNLEIPLVDNQTPIKKCGPNLLAPTNCINGYKAINVKLLTLANNHIMDQGTEGYYSTIEVLKKNKIQYVGVGENRISAAKPEIVHFCNKKIGVYACSEHEFSIATAFASGANPFDALYSFDHVESLKKETDYVIVLYHGGKEHYRYPSPNLQKICRRFAEKGADLIVCQHSHCIGCEEKYLNSTIIYGQGNFLFDNSDLDYWKTSLLIKLDESFTVSYLPLIKVDNGVDFAHDDVKHQIMSDFKLRSKEIKDPSIIQNKYDEFARSMIDFYLGRVNGKERLLYRVINKLLGNKLREHDLHTKYTKEEILQILNYIMCEAHSELFIRGLELKRDE